MLASIEPIRGMALGLEYMPDDVLEDMEMEYAIMLSFVFFRVMLYGTLKD